MSAEPRAGSPPLWKVLLIGLVTALAWPVVIAPSLWRARGFRRVAREAAGWRHRTVEGGVEVWRGADPPRLISWETSS